MKTEVSIITVTLSILQTSLDQFCVLKAGSVLPILGSILPFCIHNWAWGSLLPRDHFCGRTGPPKLYTECHLVPLRKFPPKSPGKALQTLSHIHPTFYE